MTSKIQKYDTAMADIEIALSHTESAFKNLQTVELLDTNASFLNFYCGLLDNLKEATEALQKCKLDFRKICEWVKE